MESVAALDIGQSTKNERKCTDSGGISIWRELQALSDNELRDNFNEGFVLIAGLVAVIATCASANAYQRGTPIYRACMQELAGLSMWQGNLYSQFTDVFDAIGKNVAICARTN